MQKKVLIVDDSALMRRVLSDIINSDDRFCVSKVATNGLEAFNLLIHKEENYDAIILDINMPIMNGLQFLEELNRKNVKVTVIIVSTVAKEGAKETIRALELGAFDFVTKPESFLDVKSDSFKKKLIECLGVATKLCHFTMQDMVTTEKNRNQVTSQVTNTTINQSNFQSIQLHTPQYPMAKSKKLIVIACSTGGPKALQQVVPLLYKNLDCSILIVQHMPEGFTNSLARRLDELSQVKVKEAENGEVLENGVVYIAKGGNQMRLVDLKNGNKQLSVTVEAARNGLKPCADILFESLINSDYTEITCVVLTGMGGDGTFGIKQLKEKKRIYVIAQDEATCTVYGMPKVVKEAGLVNEVVPLNKIASAINKNMGVH